MPQLSLVQDSGGVQDQVDQNVGTAQTNFPRQDFILLSNIYGTGGNYWHCVNQLRFQVPLGFSDKRVLSAYLRLATTPSPVHPTGDYQDLQVAVACHNVDNSTVETNHANIQTILSSGLTAAKLWDLGSAPTANNQTFLSTNILQPVSEVLARTGFAANNYLVLYLIVINPATSVNVSRICPTRRTATAPTYYPTLIINWDYAIPGGNLGDENLLSTIDVLQTIQVSSNRQNIQDQVTVNQTITGERTRLYNFLDSINVVQTIHILGTREREIIHELTINQAITIGREYLKDVSHTVDSFQEIIVNSKRDKQIVDSVTVDQEITVGKEYVRNILQSLDVSQIVHCGPIQVDIIHSLTVLQTLSVDAILQNHHGLTDDITVDQTVTRTSVRQRAIESDIDVQHTILVYFQSQLVRSDGGAGALVVSSAPITALNRPDTNYKPITSSGTPNTLPSTVIVNTDPVDMILQYPVISPMSSVTIPSPIFGNREEIQVTRIQRRSLDNDLFTFSDSDWPRVRTFRYQFEGVDDSLLANYETFLLLSLGLEIKLTDYEGKVWRGFIVSPGTESTDVSVGTCENTIGFEFIGVEV